MRFKLLINSIFILFVVTTISAQKNDSFQTKSIGCQLNNIAIVIPLG